MHGPPGHHLDAVSLLSLCSLFIQRGEEKILWSRVASAALPVDTGNVDTS